MSKYIKQLTRENSLLDRSFRTLAYAQSIPEVGKARMAKSPIVGIGRVTSLYYDPADYRRQQRIIETEFKSKRIDLMSGEIIKLLADAYVWAKEQRSQNFTRSQLISYLIAFNKYHAFARGAVTYGYWGEPKVTLRLKKALAQLVPLGELENTLSALSIPTTVGWPLSELHLRNQTLINKKQRLLRKLKLGKQILELTKILSWFTCFYEIGERVAGYLYRELLAKLKQTLEIKNLSVLEWYDANSLVNYLKGVKLPAKEINRRKEFYILMINNNQLAILSGQPARRYFKQHFHVETAAVSSGLKGFSASLGKAAGRVKIIITQKDIKKMRLGDVLVSTMTTPYLMEAVKKASAIVTDEGGLTAHAAIIARELGIPCVVGTRFATKLLKNGDRVEVDANKGMVKKI